MSAMLREALLVYVECLKYSLGTYSKHLMAERALDALEPATQFERDCAIELVANVRDRVWPEDGHGPVHRLRCDKQLDIADFIGGWKIDD